MEKSATFIIEKYFILVFSEIDPLHFTLYNFLLIGMVYKSSRFEFLKLLMESNQRYYLTTGSSEKCTSTTGWIILADLLHLKSRFLNKLACHQNQIIIIRLLEK